MWDIKSLETQQEHKTAAVTCQMRERARTILSDQKQEGVRFALAQILWLTSPDRTGC
jgi:Arc/MetJ family transcription regulator